MKKIWQFVYILAATVIILGQFLSPSLIATAKSVRSGDGIQASIEVNPEPIESQHKATATVTIQGSQDAMKAGDTLTVNIPSSIVDGGGLNLNGAHLDGFDGPTVNQVGDHYELIYTRNNDSTEAGGSAATISWTAPLWQNADNPQGDLTSSVTYKDKNNEVISTDSTTSTTKAGERNELPFLDKWTLMPLGSYGDKNNVALMDPSTSTNNVYDLPVNYYQDKMSAGVVTDTLPADTEFTTLGEKGVQQSNFNAIADNQVRILHVTGRGSDNWPTTFENVSDKFSDKVTISGNTLTVDFGDALKDGDSYVIEYAVKPADGQTQDTYGVKENSAKLNYTDTDGTKEVDVKHDQAIDDDSNASFKLQKSSDTAEYISGSKYLDYTITVTNNHDFTIPAGSTIEDPLVDGLSYQSDKGSTGVDTTPSINGQSVTWKLTNELKSGESAVIKFRVNVDDTKFHDGDKIENTAILHRDNRKDISTTTSTVYVFDGKIKINKTDADNGSKLAGAEFDIIDSDGKVVDHVITGTDGTITSDKLTEGTYTVKETKAPAGYQLSDQIYRVVLNSSNTQDGIVNVNITNTQEKVEAKGKIKVIKTDSKTGDKLAGAVFEIRDSSGKVVQTITTGSDGTVTSDTLLPGEYTVVETKAPDGYDLSSTEHKVTVTNNATEEVGTLNITNNKTTTTPPVTPDFTGKIKINKTDADTGKALAGAEFDILDSNNKVVDHVTTGEDGTITSKELVEGTYTLKETKAPNGYEISDKTYMVKVSKEDATNGIVSIDITNTKISTPTPNEFTGQIKINKTDVDTGAKLAGAEFDILDSNQRVVDHVVTDDNGTVTSSKLTAGTYTIKETKAPNGYELSDKAYTVTLDETQAKDGIISINITNKQTSSNNNGNNGDHQSGGNSTGTTNGSNSNGSKGNGSSTSGLLPQTGQQATWYLTVLGIILVVGAGWFLLRRKN